MIKNICSFFPLSLYTFLLTVHWDDELVSAAFEFALEQHFFYRNTKSRLNGNEKRKVYDESSHRIYTERWEWGFERTSERSENVENVLIKK